MQENIFGVNAPMSPCGTAAVIHKKIISACGLGSLWFVYTLNIKRLGCMSNARIHMMTNTHQHCQAAPSTCISSDTSSCCQKMSHADDMPTL